MKKKKESGDIPFSWEKIQAEIDANRSTRATLETLTDEQKKFIVVCRTGGVPIVFTKMCQMWESFGWGEVSHSTLKDWSYKLIKK